MAEEPKFSERAVSEFILEACQRTLGYHPGLQERPAPLARSGKWMTPETQTYIHVGGGGSDNGFVSGYHAAERIAEISLAAATAN